MSLHNIKVAKQIEQSVKTFNISPWNSLRNTHRLNIPHLSAGHSTYVFEHSSCLWKHSTHIPGTVCEIHISGIFHTCRWNILLHMSWSIHQVWENIQHFSLEPSIHVCGTFSTYLTINKCDESPIERAAFWCYIYVSRCDHNGKVSVSKSLNFETHPSLGLSLGLENMKSSVSVSKKSEKKSRQTLDLEIPKLWVSVSVSNLRPRKKKSRYRSQDLWIGLKISGLVDI